jgi:hypothetical protein
MLSLIALLIGHFEAANAVPLPSSRPSSWAVADDPSKAVLEFQIPGWLSIQNLSVIPDAQLPIANDG